MRKPWKMRLLNVAATLLAAVVLAICAHALKIAFQELGAVFTPTPAPVPVPEKHKDAPLAVTSDNPEAASAKETSLHKTPLPVNPSPRPAPAPAAVVPEMVKNPEPQVEPREEKAPLTLPYSAPPEPATWRGMGAAERLADVRARVLPKLREQLATRGCRLGQAAFIRLFKESRELELWLRGDTGEWRLFRTYPIGCFSGVLGPKTKEGDMQAPEGFYSVTARMLNPASNYHLAFNIGYPNEYDLAQKRTGSLIMVHGDLCSVGCFAMTDAVIEEIYLVVEAALKNGGSVPVHCFPFRMTAERMGRAEAEHGEFWRGLQKGYDLFETEKRVPEVSVVGGKYVVR